MFVPEDKSVVRDQAYSRKSVVAIEKHNERRNKNYGNADVVLERSEYNIHFKPPPKSYIKEFDRLVENGEIRTTGLKKDNPNIMGEMIFDINTRYFERNGGYDFAKQFYNEAYKFAVEIVGDEKYILSAVMHADERNSAVSDEFGKDVYHHHLHVVYIPVREKVKYFSKRSVRAGEEKERFMQVSHANMWDSIKAEDKKAKYSYSVLQDKFFEHMRGAGFEGFERGERGSTAEHLSVLEFKTAQEQERMARVIKEVAFQSGLYDEFVKQNEQKAAELASIEKKIGTSKRVMRLSKKLDNMGKSVPVLRQRILTSEEFDELKGLARQGVEKGSEIEQLRAENAKLRGQVNYWKKLYADLNERFEIFQAKQREFKESVKEFLEAVAHAPKRVCDFIAEVLHEKHEQEAQTEAEKPKKNQDWEIEM